MSGRTVRRTKSAAKVMIINFFVKHGTVYMNVVPNGQTVNAHQYYVLVSLQHFNSRSHPEKAVTHMTRSRWKLHHDNTRSRVANVVSVFCT